MSDETEKLIKTIRKVCNEESTTRIKSLDMKVVMQESGALNYCLLGFMAAAQQKPSILWNVTQSIPAAIGAGFILGLTVGLDQTVADAVQEVLDTIERGKP